MKFPGHLLRRKEKTEAKGFAFRLFFLLPLLISCASAPPQPTAAIHTIAAIPFYPLEDYRCGPSSLAAVLNFRGIAVTPAQMSAEIFSGAAGGTLDMDMVFYAEAKGLKVRRYAGSEADLRQNIDRGNPQIALVDYGL